jgi:hypothetical protein
MRSAGVFMLAGILAGFACSDAGNDDDHDDDEGVLCTADFRPSVLVTVLDGETVVDDALLEFSVDGDAQQACDNLEGRYACGGEQAGDFVITATRGDQSGSVALTVAEDECHVITEEVTLRLLPETEAVPPPVGD